MSYVAGPVTVTVPATSANLGPGFDSLGLALSLRDSLTAEILGEGLAIEVHGEGEGTVSLDESHLVVRSMESAFEAMGVRPHGLLLTCHNAIPHARGLGSSSAAIVGGIVLARGLVEDGESLLGDDDAFRLAAEIEGHPDNVAPAFYGGLVISGHDERGFYAVESAVAPEISAVVLVPPSGVETKIARGLLPEDVPHREAAANSGNTALLIAALAGQPDQLLRATRDHLHQEYRRAAMPESLALVDTLRAEGFPAVVSGAGPTVLVFSDGVDSHTTRELLDRAPRGWDARALSVESAGARIV